MDSNIDPDDVVVAELDVVFSNELAGLQSQLVMLQQPLRPNWRAYDIDKEGTTARFKPKAARLELSVPLDTKSDNYLDTQDEHKRIRTLDLRSSPVDDPVSSYAVGVVRDNQLILVPLDCTLQLRPNMAYLQTSPEAPGGKSRKGDGGEESEEEQEGAGDELTAVEVTVKRRETERQQQMRLKSFGHMQHEEQQEAWVPLKVVPAHNRVSYALWDKLLSPPLDSQQQQPQPGQQQPPQRQRPQPTPLSRSEYLNAFVPSSSAAAGEFARALQGDRAAVAAATGAGPPGATAAGAGSLTSATAAAAGGGAADGPLDTVPKEMAAAVGPMIRNLFQRHAVCSMANVRQWLQQQQHPQATAAASLDDQLLHALLMGSGHVDIIRRVYVGLVGANPAADGLRRVVIEMLKSSVQVRKGAVLEAAAAKGIQAADKHYQTVMKELCINNGSYWAIKTSADM